MGRTRDASLKNSMLKEGAKRLERFSGNPAWNTSATHDLQKFPSNIEKDDALR